MKYLGYELPAAEFDRLVEAVDSDQTGIIDKDEWLLEMLTKAIRHQQRRNDDLFASFLTIF